MSKYFALLILIALFTITLSNVVPEIVPVANNQGQQPNQDVAANLNQLPANNIQQSNDQQSSISGNMGQGNALMMNPANNNSQGASMPDNSNKQGNDMKPNNGNIDPVVANVPVPTNNAPNLMNAPNNQQNVDSSPLKPNTGNVNPQPIPNTNKAKPSSSSGDIVVTTINPCKSQDISLCFKLISEQMNRTEQLLNMANQTLTNSDIPAEVLPPTGTSTIAKLPVAGGNQVGNQQKAPALSDNSQQTQAATSTNNVPQTVPVQNSQPLIPTNQVQPSHDIPLSSVVPVQNIQPMNPTNQVPASQNTPSNNVVPVQNQNQAQNNPVQQPSNMAVVTGAPVQAVNQNQNQGGNVGVRKKRDVSDGNDDEQGGLGMGMPLIMFAHGKHIREKRQALNGQQGQNIAPQASNQAAGNQQAAPAPVNGVAPNVAGSSGSISSVPISNLPKTNTNVAQNPTANNPSPNGNSNPQIIAKVANTQNNPNNALPNVNAAATSVGNSGTQAKQAAHPLSSSVATNGLGAQSQGVKGASGIVSGANSHSNGDSGGNGTPSSNNNIAKSNSGNLGNSGVPSTGQHNNVGNSLASASNGQVNSIGSNSKNETGLGMSAVEYEEAELETAPEGLILVVKEAGKSNLNVGDEVDGNLNPVKKNNMTTTNNTANNAALSISSGGNNNNGVNSPSNSQTNQFLKPSIPNNLGANNGQQNSGVSGNAMATNSQTQQGGMAVAPKQNPPAGVNSNLAGGSNIQGNTGNSLPQTQPTNNNNIQPSVSNGQSLNGQSLNTGSIAPLKSINPSNNVNNPSVMVNAIPQAQQVQQEPVDEAREHQALPAMEGPDEKEDDEFDEVPRIPNVTLENIPPQEI